jgi:peptidoglycan/xylan/chitin deacetylase (PgdA/CDA1 family)
MWYPVKAPFSFSEKTIALTYDDGPGPHTFKLAEFLAGHEIRATFFFVGKNVRLRPEVTLQVHKLGHLVANHSMTHPEMPKLLGKPELVAEILETHRLIEATIGYAPRYFRAPFFAWDSRIAPLLHNRSDLPEYIGPVNCDIECGDYGIGHLVEAKKYGIGDLRSAEAGNIYTLEMCRENYRSKTHALKKGIIDLHDWAADDGPKGEILQTNNRVLEITEWLVPKLKADGFTFVGLDDPNL